MIPLLANAIEAHGGLDRWNAHERLTATIVTGGDLWILKGVDQDQAPRTMRIELHRERASVEPFGKAGRRTEFSPDRIAIVAADGRIVAERSNPRAAFARHDMRTHSGSAASRLFQRLCALDLHDCAVPAGGGRVPGPGDRTLARGRGGLARIAGDLPNRDRKPQRRAGFLFGPDMLIRRHDYRVEIAGNFPAAQYVSDPVSVDGFKLPSRRRIYLRGDDLMPLRDELMVSIDLADFRFD
ncbi:hypothetical protein ACQ5SK_04800 [Bradyrhizobium japonicum]